MSRGYDKSYIIIFNIKKFNKDEWFTSKCQVYADDIYTAVARAFKGYFDEGDEFDIEDVEVISAEEED